MTDRPGRGYEPHPPGLFTDDQGYNQTASSMLPGSYSQNVHVYNQLPPREGAFINYPQPWQRQQPFVGVGNPSPFLPPPPVGTNHSPQGMRRGKDVLARVEQAATAAYQQALSERESITIWKVTQSMLSILKVNSLDSLGLRIQEIPCLHRIILVEGKLNSFIHCYVAVRRIATLHDLSVEICRHEGVENFESLGMGPLVQHPLIVHYFAPPADIVTPFEITTEEILSHLSDFIDTCQENDIKVEEFLFYVAKKNCVSFPQQLSVRIQSIRMHIGFLRRIKKVDKNLAQRIDSEIEKKMEFERRKEVSGLQSKIISERLKLSINKKSGTSEQGPKHISFETGSSSSDDDEVMGSEKAQMESAKKRKRDHQLQKSSGSCPYPSAAEEQARLRKYLSKEKSIKCLDDDEDLEESKLQNVSNRNRKDFHSEKSLSTHSCHSTNAQLGQQPFTAELTNVCAEDVLLTDNDQMVFVAAWKNMCQERPLFQVFKTMLELHRPAFKKGWDSARAKKQFMKKGWDPMRTEKACMRTMRKWYKVFTMQPAIGLLNVAVNSMKMGLWDAVLELNKQDVIMNKDIYSRTATQVQCLQEENPIPVTKNGIISEDVVQQLIKFFEVDCLDNTQGGQLATEEWFMVLRKIWNCEKWLVKQLCIQDFASLGLGDFISFLENHFSELPQKISSMLTLHKYRDSPVVAYISRNQLLDILSQAALDLGDNMMLTKEKISVLLYKQFPLISFEVLDGHAVEEILNCIAEFKSHSQQRKTLYSAALLATNSIKEQSRLTSHVSEGASDSLQTAGVVGHMTSGDALKCLLKAPMLSNLEEWSHWEHVFAPTLGPLLNWLEKQSVNNLVCLVTRSGKMLRIDSSATLDEFMAAIVKGCAKQTAIQLVSIVSLYGGTHHTPIALMKSHACWAIDALLKNLVESSEHGGFLDGGKQDHCIICRKSWVRGTDYGSNCIHAAALEKIHISLEMVHKVCVDKSQKIAKTTQAIRLAARFILDCLVDLPPEFRTLSTQIFLPALGTLLADAFQTILHECLISDERRMLHEIGLSIGIVEWIKDYQVFSLDPSHASISTLEFQKAKSNVQNKEEHDTECNSRIDQLDGIHCSDLSSIEGGKRAVVTEVQSKYSKDDIVLRAKSNDSVISMSKTRGLLNNESIKIPDRSQEEDARRIIEAIRREEFGLDMELQSNETDLLKKQQARLGRALQCLSQELYSHDSHFLLELVQNADDNLYPAFAEPTLAFVLQSTRVLVLNNELGFTAKDIKALCDVGNSSKKASSAGYIGHKGIGFKSVFRVTDAPEIHSNGFHVKFDITEGKLGFILPTLVAPLGSLDSFSKELSDKNIKFEDSLWNTCIVLPFKDSFLDGTGMRSWVSKFADLHPSLLLFLHRLRCIKIRDSVTNTLNIIRRTDVGNGLVNVSHGKESTTWLVASCILNACTMRSSVQTTEIAMAFTLCEDQSGEYGPVLEQQPVFAFLPLRAYGLKFILQGDFILPSSREEVDGDSSWNQWLLSEFPELFVCAAELFRNLPCYQSNPGKAVTLYMSFVPLVGEVLGFFSPLPGMILSKLRASPCLPLEGKDKSWVLPCKVLRGWSDQVRILLPDKLLNNHLGLGYLHRDAYLLDPLAAALGVHAYGPGILIEIMKSLCNNMDALRDLGLNWLGSWLVALYDCLKFRPGGCETSFQVKQESDYLTDLRQLPFIPLSDGSFTSHAEGGSIWLPCEVTEVGVDTHILKNFPRLYSELRTVHSSLFYASTVGDVTVRADSDVIVRMLLCIGVGQLSAHEVLMTHILPAMSSNECMARDKLSLAEFLAFAMLHLQSNCSLCYLERKKLIVELQNKAVIITNNGYKRATSEPLHFSREFGNPIDVRKILAGTNVVWNEVDSVYLQIFSSEVEPLNLSQWRMFFQELGVTDFVQVFNVEKKVENQSCTIWKDMEWDGFVNAAGWTINDWESPELIDILTALSSSSTNLEEYSCLLEVLDNLWDDIYGAKKATYWSGSPGERKIKCTETSLVLQIRGHRWVKSKFDGKLYFPTDLFFDCDDVKSILGFHAPYATPKVRNRKLVADIGLRTQVCVRDALDLIYKWSKLKSMFKASISQMERLYSFLWTRMDTCREEVAAHFRVNSSVFVPLVDGSNPDDTVEGMFLPVDQLYWKDPTGCLDLLKREAPCSTKLPSNDRMCLRALCHVYPNLHNFFTNGCGVQEIPDFDGYVKIVQNISRISRPSQAYKEVIQVLSKWAKVVESGMMDSKEISHWKDCLHNLDCSVLPTIQDKWVSLHQNVGLVCWCDDVELGKQFRHCNGIHFLCLHADGKFGKMRGKETLPSKILTFMCAMGIPSLSEVVAREAIYYGLQDNNQILSLINWILPYAQRYLYRMHPEVYHAVKDTIFSNPSNCLCLLVVDKLFYRHILQGCQSVSNKLHECSCLLEGNTFYVSQEAEYSAIYLELSRLFFKGCVNLQLSNFLHLITIMAESGSTEEQTESFIINAQTIPKLPQEEVRWICEHRDQSDKVFRQSSPTIPENNFITKKPRQCSINRSWPPTTWFDAPRSRYALQPEATISGLKQDSGRSDDRVAIENVLTQSSINSACQGDWVEDDLKDSMIPRALDDSKLESDRGMEKVEVEVENAIITKDDLFLESPVAGLENAGAGMHSVKMSASEEIDGGTSSIFSKRSKLCWGVPDDEQRHLTGKLGEQVVYKYLIEKHGPMSVNWINEKEETGLPFDMILIKEKGKKEFIEVKATRSEYKDWFEITSQEWAFASKNSDCFTIIRVILASMDSVKLVMLSNPMKLCQQKLMKLVLLMPTNQHFALPEVTFTPYRWNEMEASGVDNGL